MKQSAADSIRVACVQLNSGPKVDENLAVISSFLEVAAERRAEVVLLPENCAQMPRSRTDRHIDCFPPSPTSAPVTEFLLASARKFGLTIIAGSVAVSDAAASSNLPFARTLVISPAGLQASYNKVHLFDVETEVDGKSVRYRESNDYVFGAPSQLTSAAPTNLWRPAGYALKFGLSICYDLRFPEFYRRLSQCGATVFTAPAAFTYETGELHWETLLRARAIENQAFVMAAAQCGNHPTRAADAPRRTWGHSMIVDPQGRVLAQSEHEPDLIIADLDLTFQHNLRQRFPVLTHPKL